MKKSRKTVVVANRERARKRREQARLEGKCIVLCGRPQTPGLNAAGKPFTTCEECRLKIETATKTRRKQKANA